MRKVVLICFIVFTSLHLSSIAIQAAFGVSPAEINYEYLTPGIKIEKEFLLSRTELEEEVEIVVEPDVEGANAWFTIEPAVAFKMRKGERSRKMKVIISAPAVLTRKNYEGYIVVKVVEGGQKSGVALAKGVGIKVKLTASEVELTKMLIRHMELPDVAEGEAVRLILTVENQGNISAAPEKVKVDVFDVSLNKILTKEATFSENVGPGDIKNLAAEFENELGIGNYSAEVVVFFEGEPILEDKLVFDVIEPKEEEIEVVFQNRNINPYIVGGVITASVLVLLLIKRTRKNSSLQNK